MMAPFVFTFCLVLLWIAVTILLSWIATRQEDGPKSGTPDYNSDNIQRAAQALIISTVVCVLTVTFILPLVFHVDTTPASQWVHHVGVVLLGTFLVVALYLQIKIWMKVKRYADRNPSADMESVRRSYENWRGITEFLPAPAAIMILLSGMSLLYTKAGYSIGRGWIFTLILVLSVMMSDGIFGYTYDVRGLLQAADIAVHESDGLSDFEKNTRNRVRDLKLFIYSLSFPFLVVFPAFKIWDSSSPASPLLRIAHLENRTGWPQVWPALVLFAIPFLIVAALNRFGHSIRRPG